MVMNVFGRLPNYDTQRTNVEEKDIGDSSPGNSSPWPDTYSRSANMMQQHYNCHGMSAIAGISLCSDLTGDVIDKLGEG